MSKDEDDLHLVFDQHGGAAAHLVRERLDAFNIGTTGISAYYPVNYFVRNGRAEIMGGVLGGLWGGCLHITYLWVDAAVRGRGCGTMLMDAAEDLARTRGGRLATLDTHSFQARPFYEKRGYEVFATLDDYPVGHKKFFLKKKL